MFRRVLVANRGEIAVRIIRAIHELGAEAVAIYSEADRQALHVRLADYAYPVGPAPAAQSYLSVDAILGAARRSGAEAIHPGYGFLSENAGFARACAAAGLVFVGPSPEALEQMGDKVAARRIAAAAGVPTVPGTAEPVDAASAPAAARQIGFPLLIKAAAGGGGKGMRAVRAAEDLDAALAQARSEAAASFGDGSVYLERLVESPRHIEVQLFGDGAGRVWALGERECSLQRRYQKVVEECPAPNLPEQVRHQLWAAAVVAAAAVKYAGAGTIEFLYEPSSGAFFFLEMNARLQVEHPVTELVSGVDLVQAQLRLAAGATLEEALGIPSLPTRLPSRPPLGPSQADADTSARTGVGAGSAWSNAAGHRVPGHTAPSIHAIEVRVCAEDPAGQWFPSTGHLSLVREPGGPGIRVDSACEPGQEVTVHYDPLLAKLIAWGRTREEAINRLRRALDEYVLAGVRTTLPFHRWLVRQPAFLAADLSTSFIADHWHPETNGGRAQADGAEARTGTTGQHPGETSGNPSTKITTAGDLAPLIAAAVAASGHAVAGGRSAGSRADRAAGARGPEVETSRWRDAARRGALR